MVVFEEMFYDKVFEMKKKIRTYAVVTFEFRWGVRVVVVVKCCCRIICGCMCADLGFSKRNCVKQICPLTLFILAGFAHNAHEHTLKCSLYTYI